MKIEELKQQQFRRVRKRKRRTVAILIVMLILVTVLGALYYRLKQEDKKLELTTYHIETDKIEGEYRIALMSDQHNSEFGENNSDLVQMVRDTDPDLILMCGDMVNKNDPDVSVVTNLCSQLIDTADVYYIIGNHEGVLMYDESGYKVPLDQYLTELGVKICYTGEYSIEAENSPISFFSISMEEESYEANPDLQKAFELFTDREEFKIVVSHYPAILYDTLQNADFDLALAGHYHGGQVNVSGKGGLYHKDTGFFPKYYGGIYQLDKGQLIVTRGLGNTSVIPRINNRPELVLIDING